MARRSDRKDDVSSTELAQILERTDWSDLVPRLLLYTARRLRRFGNQPATAAKAEDYVQEAVVLLLEGRRHFSPGAGRSLFAFLAGVIDSLIAHAAAKTRHKVSATPSTGSTPPVAGNDIDDVIAAHDAANEFLATLGADVQAYARLRLSEDLRPEEYASVLNISVDEVRNMQRRLKRYYATNKGKT
jgi:RNA polymerase sigma factor (sigma-70 family)